MSKRYSFAGVLILAAILAPSPCRAADVHAVVQTVMSYRGSDRTTSLEYWVATDKMMAKSAGILFITRRDLGLIWGVDQRAATYSEEKIQPAKPAVEDIHTAGYDFGMGPVDWRIEPAGGARTIAGVACDHFVGRGTSDVGEITVDLWAAPASTPGGAELLKAMIGSLRGDSRRSEIVGLLEKVGRAPLEREETIEGPIAPVMKYAVKVVKLETAESPAGTYDLPAGVRKETEAGPSGRPSETARPPFALPPAVLVELKRLDETYRVLDAVADKVWTGWANYRQHPFLFDFENGLKVLVGHPRPPQGFERLAGVSAGGRDVYIDRSRMSGLEVRQPLSCGGGIGALGDVGGRPVRIVDMKFRKIADDPSAGKEPFRSERTVIILVHELFHLFQDDAVQFAYGNLLYNADAHYALYSAVEGLALDAAFHETDPDRARRAIKDFLLARDLKRQSMTAQQALEESSDDVREGTAVYSEIKTLEALREGFRPGLTTAEDPHYGGFKDIDGLLKSYSDRVKASAADFFDAKGKCYTYGSFQALLLQRLFPGWQAPFAKEARRLDDELARRIPLTQDDRAGAARRFQDVYGLKALKAKADQAMAERTAAFKAASGGQGTTFAISLKEVGQFAESLIAGKKSFRLGLTTVCPDGAGTLAFDDVSLEIRSPSFRVEKLYHLILKDPEAARRATPYEIAFERQEGPDVFINAVVTAPSFTLKAPKLKLAASAGRVKIWILARVRG